MKNLLSYSVLAGLCAATFFVAAGCETEPAGDALVTITPISVQLQDGEEQAFEASGANSYKWSLETGSYGYLSALTGSRVVYTSTYSGGASNVVTEILTVSGTLDSSTSTGGVYTAQATIIHLDDA